MPRAKCGVLVALQYVFPETRLACPYFVPREILNDGSWPHPSRLPLGAGWNGGCCATAQEHIPSDFVIRESCNLGNATSCPHLPTEREWDAVRFSLASSSLEQVVLWYVCEHAHAPVEHGRLTFDRTLREWRVPHRDARVLRLADAYLEAWRMRQIPIIAESSVATANTVEPLGRVATLDSAPQTEERVAVRMSQSSGS